MHQSTIIHSIRRLVNLRLISRCRPLSLFVPYVNDADAIIRSGDAAESGNQNLDAMGRFIRAGAPPSGIFRGQDGLAVLPGGPESHDTASLRTCLMQQASNALSSELLYAKLYKGRKQTVKRAADNKRRYAPGERSIPPILLSGVSKGACPLAHNFACKV